MQNGFKIKKGASLQPVDLTTLTNPQAGDIACDINDSNKIKFYDTNTLTWKEMGGGSAPLDTVFQLFAEEPITDWNMFTPGGQGSFVKVTSGQLHGDASYRMTLGTFNNLLSGPIKAVDPRFRGNTATLYFPYTFDGTNTDLRVQLIANPSGTPVNLIPDDVYIQGTNGGNGIYKINVQIPTNCTQIQFKVFQVATNVGKILNFDDIQLTTDKTIYANIANITAWSNPSVITVGATTTAPTKPTAGVTFDSVRYRQVGEFYEVEYWYRSTATTGGSAGSGDYLFSLPAGVEFDSIYAFYTGATGTYPGNVPTFESNIFTQDGSGGIGLKAIPYSATQFRVRGSYVNGGTGAVTSDQHIGSAFFQLAQATTNYKFHLKFKGKGLTATSPQVLIANDTFSTDSANLTYSSTYNLTTLASAPVGTFITYTYAANTNTRVQTSTAPTQSVSDMNANGIQIFTRAYNAASTAASPACVAIQIGKGMKGVTNNLYKSTGKATSGVVDFTLLSTTHVSGLFYKDYNESSGILIMDAGIDPSAATTTRTLNFSDITAQSNGYLVINASKSPALTGVTLPKRYIVNSFQSGTDWWEVYNDGWVRQGGFINSGLVTRSLLITMGNADYGIQITAQSEGTTSYVYQPRIRNATTASQIVAYIDVDTARNRLVVEGYGDSAAVKALGAKPTY